MQAADRRRARRPGPSWHRVLRRAAQFGRHDAKRQTHGHSAIVDPWGAVLAQAPEKECVVLADFDAEYLQTVRRRIPVLEHERPDVYESN